MACKQGKLTRAWLQALIKQTTATVVAAADQASEDEDGE